MTYVILYRVMIQKQYILIVIDSILCEPETGRPNKILPNAIKTKRIISIYISHPFYTVLFMIYMAKRLSFANIFLSLYGNVWKKLIFTCQ